MRSWNEALTKPIANANPRKSLDMNNAKTNDYRVWSKETYVEENLFWD